MGFAAAGAGAGAAPSWTGRRNELRARFSARRPMLNISQGRVPKIKAVGPFTYLT